MRSHQLKISLLMISAVIFGVVAQRSSPDDSSKSMDQGVAERQPSSFPVATLEEVNQEGTEVYSFDRRMKGILNERETLTDIHYQGNLFVDWKKISPQNKIGTFSFRMKDADVPGVFAEATLDQNYVLTGLKTSIPANENEEDALLFLKDLISIYAFGTFEDTSGKYIASLSIAEEVAGKTVWIKKKLKYEDPTFAEIRFLRSVHELRVDQTLDEASGLEEAHMGKELKTLSVYRLKRLSQQESQGLKKVAFGNSIGWSADTLKTDPHQRAAVRVSWAEIQKKLEEASRLSGKERLAMFHDLLRSLKGNPEAISSFVEWARGGSISKEKAALSIGLLSSVGTPEAQQALVHWYEDAKNDSKDTAHLILNSFATHQGKLSAEASQMLHTALESGQPDLAENAAYALGASGDVKKITEMAEKAESKEEKLVYIEAMGNGGSTDSLQYLLMSAQSQDPQIREKAIFALRFVNDDKVKAVFESAMNDASPGVRFSVVRAIPFQAAPKVYEGLLQACAVKAPEQNLKALCSQTLAGL